MDCRISFCVGACCADTAVTTGNRTANTIRFLNISKKIKAFSLTLPIAPSIYHPAEFPDSQWNIHHNPHTSTQSPTTARHYPADTSEDGHPGNYDHPADKYSSS